MDKFPAVFIPLHFRDKLNVINPLGNIGVVTLWSKIDWVCEKLREARIDLSPDSSPISVIGNLYGNGLPEMLRNLLYNPQINLLIVCGNDKSGSSAELVNFFNSGLETVEFLGEEKLKISGTNRIVDKMLIPEMFEFPPVVINVGDLKSEQSLELLKNAFKNNLNPVETEARRIEIPLPVVNVVRFPSNPRIHQIISNNPLDAWIELIFRLLRYGVSVKLKKGYRQELQNVRVVVETPGFINEAKLTELGFDSFRFMEYYNTFLDKDIPVDVEYTYGSRLGDYFGIDTIEECVNNLRKDREDRKSYISLWDSGKDIASTSGHPCLSSLFFRVFEDKLTLTASFRTHNSLDAWLKNFYGLMKIQNTVSEKLGIENGAITIISHSISIDPRRIETAKSIAGLMKSDIVHDPCGNFHIQIENDEIVARHFYKGIKIDEYRGKTPLVIQHKLNKNRAISDINHAMYIGRMLEKAARCMETGTEFIQE
jgi:thymidylate synthase